MEKILPKGWILSNIEDAVEILDSKRQPVSADERAKRIGKVPYYGATGLAGYIDDFIFNEELVLLGEDGAPFFDKSKNVAFIISGKSWVNNHAHVLKAKRITSNKFILSYLNQFDYNGYVGGTTRLKLTQGDLKRIPFPLPPLPEQKRIVVKLDKLFGALDKIKTRLDKIPGILKNFRQQVLTQAVTGKLTEEWREGKELGEWEDKQIQKFTTKVGSGSTPKGGQDSYLSEGIPLIRSMNIHFKGIKYDGLAFIDEKQAKSLQNVEVKEEDVLLNITGASIGRVCLAPKRLHGARVNQHVTIIRVIRDIILPEFLNLYLSSPKIQSYISSENYGVTRQALTKTQLLNIVVSVPELIEQKEILNRVKSLFAKVGVIEEKYKKIKAIIETLPQAILHKAFKGELVEQLPTDGDAKELLEEIMKLKKEVKGRRENILN